MPANKPMQDEDFRFIQGDEVGINEQPSIYHEDGTPHGDPESWGHYVICTRDKKGKVQGYSCLGFDVCIDRCRRYSDWLYRFTGKEVPGVMVKRGSFEAYDLYKRCLNAISGICDLYGIHCDADLHPQLSGLEGKRVEVVDEFDRTRRFYVGRSTGWLPIHLEVHNRRSLGGGSAVGSYKSVRVV